MFLMDNEISFEERKADDGKEDEKEDDDRGEEECSKDGDSDMEEGEEAEDCFMRFAVKKDSLDSAKDGVTGANDRQQSLKKPWQGVIGASLEEIFEFRAMTYGGRRRTRKPKKRGRRNGSRTKLSPEIVKKLGDATLHYAYGRLKDAISILTELVLMAPNLPDAYHTLGLIYNSMGDKNKAVGFCEIAAKINPKESSRWKLLVDWSIEEGNIDQALKYLDRAINADQTDITLKYRRASLCVEKGEYSNAAESYDQIVQICPNNVEALKTAAQLHKQCGQLDRSISMLEDYLKNQSSEADLGVVDMLALSCMDRNEFMRALQHIEHANVFCGSGKEFPLNLTIRKGVCHAHLGDMEKAEVCFSLLQRENAEHQMDLIMEVANSFVNLQQHESALKYYMMLEGCRANNEYVYLKIAHCYSTLKKATKAIHFFYKVLQAREDDIDARLALVSHLLGVNREDEAIVLLSPPPTTVLTNNMDEDKHEPWWLNVRVKLKLSQIYRTKGMLEAFVAVIYPVIRESLEIDSVYQKAKQRKRRQRCELPERCDVSSPQTDSVFALFGSSKRPASKVNLLKANGRSEEEEISSAMACRLDLESSDVETECSEIEDLRYEVPQQPLKQPPLPDLFKDKEHLALILDLCTALTSLRRYNEALELIKLTLKVPYKTLPTGMKELFWALGAKIALNITDPSDGFDFVRYIVQKHPQSIAAWNCYYRLVLRLENRLSKHDKFLHRMQIEHKDLIPPMIIVGNQFTMISQHQKAAKEYLEAYKQMPENPLINLCIGTALVNLALGHRLRNKHHCVGQGLAFLYNNLRLCKNSQEALYNVARAYHHVGQLSLAASYYEKVLAFGCPMPEAYKDPVKYPDFGYCNLHREAAYNLHLIYKNSGADDLARQVLRDYCTV